MGENKEKNQIKKTFKALYAAADELEAFFDKCCTRDERRADHSALKLRAECNEYGSYLEQRFKFHD